MDNDQQVRRLRATAHPVRLQILSLLTGADLSATEVAVELGLTQANASYHLRRLRDVGLLVETGRRSVRGGVAKLYRHPYDVDAPTESAGEPDAQREHAVPAADWQAYLEAVAAELLRRAGGRREHTPTSTTDAELWVTPEVWARVTEAVGAASLDLHASARPPRTAGTRRYALTAAAFETTPPPTAADQPGGGDAP